MQARNMTEPKAVEGPAKTNDIPIDIHFNKLLDWLLKRRHCKPEWTEAAHDIRTKINAAITDMPEHPDVTALLHGSYINYFHCLRIIDILKETEAASKNIFGRYSSQRMKDWQEIVKLYEKDCTYLAEAAQMLSRYVNYEIPALKRQLAGSRKSEEDFTRKEHEHAGAAADCRQKYLDACKHMGIEGKHVKAELSSLAADLPATFDVIAKRCRSLDGVITFYRSFVTFVCGSCTHEVCPMLQTLMEKGNVTTYEWRTGIAPQRVVAEKAAAAGDALSPSRSTNPNATANEPAVTSDEIDWSAADELCIEENPSDGIDFGTEEIGIELADEGISEITMSWDEGMEAANPEAGGELVAKGRDALTVLDNPVTRAQFVDDLIELDSFLEQRLVELQKGLDVIMTSQLQSAPKSVAASAEDVAQMRASVAAIISDITSSKMQQLMSIRNSPRYVDRVTERLQKMQDMSEKMAASSRLAVLRQQEAREEQRLLQPKLSVLVARTKELKAQVEKDISKKYDDRPVNIMGEINAI